MTSNGAGSAPTWQTSAVDTGIEYTWTDLHTFSAGLLSSASSTLTNLHDNASQTNSQDRASNGSVDVPFEVSASANVKYSADTERTLSDASYTLQKAIKIRVPGIVRVSFDIARTTATDAFG